MTFLKTTTAALALFLAVPVAFAVADANEPDVVSVAKDGPTRGEKRLQRMTETLDLTDAQVAEIAAIQADFKEANAPTRKQIKELRAQIRAQKEVMHADILDVLTPEQAATFEANKAEFKGKKGKRGKRKGHKRGGHGAGFHGAGGPGGDCAD